ncbi:MAG: rhodanese-like domain-containing protein [Spirochaetes bacterium]|nr:rhodanese-like domain-containing protein [Spirochaetota bacterium]
MKHIIYTLASILSFISLSFLGTARVQGTTNAAIRQISPDEAEKLIRANAGSRDFVILDIRTPGEYRDGHIPGAALLDYYSLSFRSSLEALDKNRTYFVYCRSDNRTGRALKIMGDLGFTRVYELRGGIQAWLSSGRMLQVH